MKVIVATFLYTLPFICNFAYMRLKNGISEERILQFTNVIGLVICEFAKLEPIFQVPIYHK